MKCPCCEVELAPETIGGGAHRGPEVGPYRTGPAQDLADPRVREIDRCPECGGVWFDAGEMAVGLREIAPPRHAVALPESIPAEEQPLVEAPTLPCPRCASAMVTLRSRAARGVAFERCPTCQGVWFDAGELRRFAEPVAVVLALMLDEFP